MDNKNSCLVCGELLVGRPEKRFCSSKCKSAHQYEVRKQNESFFFKIDRQLKTNRKILKKYNQSGFTTLRKSVLIEEGFNPKFFTHYWKNSKGEVYFFCYDYGFLLLKSQSKEKYLIVEWQDYMS